MDIFNDFDTDGEAVFTKVNGTTSYDVLVRTYVKGEDKKVEKVPTPAYISSKC